MTMMEGLRPGPLFDSLSKNVPEMLSALQGKVDKYIIVEELDKYKHRRRGKSDQKRKEPDSRQTDYKGNIKKRRHERDGRRQINDRRPHTPPRRTEVMLPPLNAPIV